MRLKGKIMKIWIDNDINDINEEDNIIERNVKKYSNDVKIFWIVNSFKEKMRSTIKIENVLSDWLWIIEGELFVLVDEKWIWFFDSNWCIIVHRSDVKYDCKDKWRNVTTLENGEMMLQMTTRSYAEEVFAFVCREDQRVRMQNEMV